MTDKKGGRPSLEEVHGEPIRTVKVRITQTQYDFASHQPEGGISAFIRYAIDAVRYARTEMPSDTLQHARAEARKLHEHTEEIIEKTDNNRENESDISTNTRSVMTLVTPLRVTLVTL